MFIALAVAALASLTNGQRLSENDWNKLWSGDYKHYGYDNCNLRELDVYRQLRFEFSRCSETNIFVKAEKNDVGYSIKFSLGDNAEKSYPMFAMGNKICPKKDVVFYQFPAGEFEASYKKVPDIESVDNLANFVGTGELAPLNGQQVLAVTFPFVIWPKGESNTLCRHLFIKVQDPVPSLTPTSSATASQTFSSVTTSAAQATSSLTSSVTSTSSASTATDASNNTSTSTATDASNNTSTSTATDASNNTNTSTATDASNNTGTSTATDASNNTSTSTATDASNTTPGSNASNGQTTTKINGTSYTTTKITHPSSYTTKVEPQPDEEECTTSEKNPEVTQYVGNPPKQKPTQGNNGSYGASKPDKEEECDQETYGKPKEDRPTNNNNYGQDKPTSEIYGKKEDNNSKPGYQGEAKPEATDLPIYESGSQLVSPQLLAILASFLFF